MPKPLTEADILALEHLGPQAEVTVVTPTAGEVTVTETPAAPNVDPEKKPEATNALEQAKTPSADLVAFLQGQVTAQAAQVLELNLANRDLQAKVDSFKLTRTPMVKLVQDSVNNMRVGLGGSAMDLTTLSDEALLAEHARVREDFKKKYPVGGVAAVAPEDKKTESAAAAASPIESAKLAAVRFGKK